MMKEIWEFSWLVCSFGGPVVWMEIIFEERDSDDDDGGGGGAEIGKSHHHTWKYGFLDRPSNFG